MPSVRGSGVELHYEEDGVGADAVVLVHPLMTSLGYWEPFRDSLTEGRRLVLYDCRGHGRSERGGPYSMDDHIADLAALIEALGLERPALVGYSMGAYICLGVVTRHPDLVSRAVLASVKSVGKQASAAAHIDSSIRNGADAIDQVQTKVFASEPDPVYVGFLKSLARTLDRKEVEHALGGSGGFDYRADLESVTAPVLMVHGTDDVLNPIAHAKGVAASIPGARLVEFPGCGHECPMEAPGTFTDEVARFLDEKLEAA